MDQKMRNNKKLTGYMRKVIVKIGFLIVLMVVGICVVEAVLFHYVGGGGWNAAGPSRHFDTQSWLTRFGGLPSETVNTVQAPVMTHGEFEAIELSHVQGPHGLVWYFLGGGMSVPVFPLVQHVRQYVQLRNEVRYYPSVRGFAFLSSDDVLWCQVHVALPYDFRTREFIGTAADIPPVPSDKRWRTSGVDGWGLIHNVVIWLALFGWLFFLRELRDGFRLLFSRRHFLIRNGRCGECGYDLQQLQTPRCPECGVLRVGTAGMWNRQHLDRAIVSSGLGLTLIAPAYLSLANAPSWISPGSIWVIYPLLAMESRMLAVLTPVLLFGLCMLPVWMRPTIGRILVTTLIGLLLTLTMVYFAALWRETSQWWGTDQLFAMAAANALCASGCVLLWIRFGRYRTYGATIAVMYSIWLWMTWAGFPLLYDVI
jgi:hypothetical protein